MLKNEIILMIEDNPDDEKLTLNAMKKNNILNDIIIARDGAEALNYIFGNSQHQETNILENLKVILLDLNLPKISGIEVLKKIKKEENTKLLPVIILTSSNDEKDISECYKLGANSYIQKNVDFKQFAEAIKHIGIYWLKFNKTPNIIKWNKKEIS